MPGNLPEFKLLTSTALDLAVPIRFHMTVVEFQLHYHTTNSHNCMGVNGKALQLHGVYKKLYFYNKSRDNPVSVLQVT